MNTDNILSVSQLNKYIKMLMESDEVLNYVTLRGEISNFKYHSSGHMYFTLKDEASEIAAVMFRGAASKLNFTPKSGMQVTAYGRVSVYEVSGKYQLYVNVMVNDGAGSLYAEYMRLLEKLRAEGLFDEARKKPLPRFPPKNRNNHLSHGSGDQRHDKRHGQKIPLGGSAHLSRHGAGSGSPRRAVRSASSA